jgi:hypothetical protein
VDEFIGGKVVICQENIEQEICGTENLKIDTGKGLM